MEYIFALTIGSLIIAFAILVGLLLVSIGLNRKAQTSLDAAWVILEAAHPEDTLERR